MITVCSIFRDASEHLDRYFHQVAELRLAFDVRLALAEGDSHDDTWDALNVYAAPGDLVVKIDHNGPRFGSVDHPQRWAQIAHVVTGLLGKVDDPGAALIWVEGDLMWDVPTFTRLLDDLARTPTALAVSPLVVTDVNRFYDTWGFRKDGQHFNPWHPYFDGPEDRLVKIDSCGSCFAASPAAYPAVFGWDGFWPFTADGDLWLDPTLAVRHP